MAFPLKFVHATQRPLGAISGQHAGSSDTRNVSVSPGTKKDSRDLIFFSLENCHERVSGSSRFALEPVPRAVDAMSAAARIAIPFRALDAPPGIVNGLRFSFTSMGSP